MIVKPFLTHSSITEMSDVVFVSEVPTNLARYVTCIGDSGKQANDASLSHYYIADS